MEYFSLRILSWRKVYKGPRYVSFMVLPKKMSEDKNGEILKRLNLVVYLLLENVKKDASLREKIDFLNKAGLSNKEIAEILNKSQNYVAVELNVLRKKRK